MIYISHRGNIDGVISSRENSLDYIQEAIDRGYDVEIDLRMKDGTPYLGHDYAEYPVSEQWLVDRKDRLWIHIKEYAALQWILPRLGLTYFCHQSDAYTLVSNGKVWCHDWTNPMNEHCVIPLITLQDVEAYDVSLGKMHAICSDYILDCVKKFG
jgi:hypothetical protein